MTFLAPTPTPVTGNPPPASWGIQVATDLALLGEFCSMYSYGSSLDGGTPPATGSATFLMMDGLASIPFSSGGGTLTFPSPFPNHLHSFTAMLGSASPSALILTWDAPAASQITLFLYNTATSSAAPNATYSISYMAKGY